MRWLFMFVFIIGCTVTPADEEAGASLVMETGNISSIGISGHSAEGDCWIAYDGKVYDITAWVQIHPGGKKPLLAQCGKDFTSAFEGKHGTSKVTMLEKQGIMKGRLDPSG